ncbi:hypothetical protein, partial [Paenibacillus glycanilyticus]|uniref:hypothetical protein n=1 Tax=Paenibacillus glycanilyticus TaxID=126569 RepID=UPI0024E13724
SFARCSVFKEQFFSTTRYIISRRRFQCQALFFINFNFYQSMLFSLSSQPLVSRGRNKNIPWIQRAMQAFFKTFSCYSYITVVPLLEKLKPAQKNAAAN